MCESNIAEKAQKSKGQSEGKALPELQTLAAPLVFACKNHESPRRLVYGPDDDGSIICPEGCSRYDDDLKFALYCGQHLRRLDRHGDCLDCKSIGYTPSDRLLGPWRRKGKAETPVWSSIQPYCKTHLKTLTPLGHDATNAKSFRLAGHGLQCAGCDVHQDHMGWYCSRHFIKLQGDGMCTQCKGKPLNVMLGVWSRRADDPAGVFAKSGRSMKIAWPDLPANMRDLKDRKEALAAGDTQYMVYDEKAGVLRTCPHGHVAPRRISDRTCVECHYRSELSRRRRKTLDLSHVRQNIDDMTEGQARTVQRHVNRKLKRSGEVKRQAIAHAKYPNSRRARLSASRRAEHRRDMDATT